MPLRAAPPATRDPRQPSPRPLESEYRPRVPTDVARAVRRSSAARMIRRSSSTRA
jgi:hypothetical protein